MSHQRKKVAVMGGGIAGISAAYALAKAGIEVDLIESQDRLGGDVRSVKVYGWDGSEHLIDAGVTDFNAATFFNYKNFLEELNIPFSRINRATSFSEFPRPRPLYFVTNDGQTTFYKDFLQDKDRFLNEITRFRTEAHTVLKSKTISEFDTLESYLDHHQYGSEFRHYFLYPRASSAFLMPEGGPAKFPLKNLVRFMMMHSMIGPYPSQRSVVAGGMNHAIPLMHKALEKLQVNIITSSVIESIKRDDLGVHIAFSAPQLMRKKYDELVVACKPNRIEKLFQDLSEQEKNVFNSFTERKDEVVIHGDPDFLSRSPRAWGAFNISVRGAEIDVPTVTFWPNSMDDLGPKAPNVLVTLNPQRTIRDEYVMGKWQAFHSLASGNYSQIENDLKALQGTSNTWYCGSYVAVPFLHETAFTSGQEISKRILDHWILEGLQAAPRTFKKIS